MRGLAVAAALMARAALAHDVSFDLFGSGTRASDAVPRTGSAGASLAGSYDATDALSVWLGGTYTRDFATRTAESASTGSNIVLLSPGLLYQFNDHWSVMATGSFSPKTVQRSATTVTVKAGTAQQASADVVVRSENSSAGGSALVSWSSSGDSDFESGVDVGVSATHFDVFQQQEVPDTVKGRALKSACAKRTASDGCQLINGASTPLWQGKVSAGYTATLWRKLLLGLDASLYLYDQDPTQVGYFSLVLLGRDVGQGVPTSPYVFSLKPSASWKWEKVTLKASWQAGFYSGGAGSAHSLLVKLTWKATKSFRLSASVLGQLDKSDAGTSYTGTTLTLGTMALF